MPLTMMKHFSFFLASLPLLWLLVASRDAVAATDSEETASQAHSSPCHTASVTMQFV
jgi:hypothetical protein